MDEEKNLMRALFDANVRDFLGENEVNEKIFEKLETIGEEDFWWFNNGITLVADKVDQKGKRLALNEPLLVNGLQTSNVIFSFMRDTDVEASAKDDVRNKMVLVKVIQTPNEAVRDEVIRATNNQSNIPKPYLRSMDRVHRNIDDHLKVFGLFYERRKNQYRNAGKARAFVITVTEMGQALMSALLFRSSDARGRPNSLLKSEQDYDRLFSEAFHLDTYKNIIQTYHRIRSMLGSLYIQDGAAYRNNVVWHVLMYLSQRRFHNYDHAVNGWRNFVPTDAEVEAAINRTAELFLVHATQSPERVAKSKIFEQKVRETAVEDRSVYLPGTFDIAIDKPPA